ncbi:engulfment and cell motility protein 1 isoform X1 [Tachysurus ichikawai]
MRLSPANSEVPSAARPPSAIQQAHQRSSKVLASLFDCLRAVPAWNQLPNMEVTPTCEYNTHSSRLQIQHSRLTAIRPGCWRTRLKEINGNKSRKHVQYISSPGRGQMGQAEAVALIQVMQVVREQITRALTNKPNSLDQFKTRLQNLSYTEILKIRQSERMNQEDFQSRPILELREKIQPEIMELIKQQRLNRLCEGTCFRKISSRRRQDKFWYCRLSPNHKVLHYGDLEESPQGEVPHDSLQDKLPVADIKAVVTGKDCPHMKEKGALKQNKELLELAFSILYESDEYLNFIAPDRHEYCVWTDGLNALLGKEMTSEFTRSDLDTLLNMEMKLRLLDLENIQIPEAPPPIPKEPSNYDFVYDCN